jgi:cyanate permease
MATAADPKFRGASMAMHSTVGFAFTAAGGWVVGIVLDIAGEVAQPHAWALAYAVMAAAAALGPVCLWWSRRTAKYPT